MVRKSRAAVLEAAGRISIREFDVPRIGPGEGLLRLEMTGVCGSDPKFYHGKSAVVMPIILGHEILGRIEEIGEEASRLYGVGKGDRVVVEANIRCGSCPYCLSGDYQFCQGGHGYGTRVSADEPPHLWGGYGEFMYLTPGSVVHKVSTEVPAEAAVLTTAVIANGIQWVRRLAGASIGDTVVIQGPGQQGLAATIAARESGASPIVVTGLSIDGQRLALAQEFGADHVIDVEREDVVGRIEEITRGRMADIVVDVTGSPKAVAKSLDLVRPMGTILCAGLTGTDTLTSLAIDILVHKQLRLQGARSKSSEAVVSALKLVESRKYPLEKMVSHRFPLERAEEAVKTAGGDIPGVYATKVVITP